VEVAVLFSDIRNFTQYSEQQLPFDVVHILNSYYTAVVECVLNNNGYLDKYLGDGIMAIFGIRGESKKDICTNAIRAAVAMTEAAEKLSRKFEKEFNMPLRTGIGIHFGKVIIGAMGHVRQKHMTVIGDTVNTACRVEAATKEVGSKILITENIVKELSGILKLGAPMPVQLKGKSESTTLYPCHGFAKSDPIALVQSSLELLTPNSGEFCDVFYGNLFRLYPETKTLFKGDMDQQSQMLLALIASGVKCLNRVNEIEGSFTALGQRHIGYGVTLEDYDKIVDVMMITLDNYLGSQFTNDMRQAWEHVLKVIVRIMIQGAGEINT
jgi:class 3 adenylate cyclase/hemoglobin-like flavoprotein